MDSNQAECETRGEKWKLEDDLDFELLRSTSKQFVNSLTDKFEDLDDFIVIDKEGSEIYPDLAKHLDSRLTGMPDRSKLQDYSGK